MGGTIDRGGEETSQPGEEGESAVVLCLTNN